MPELTEHRLTLTVDSDNGEEWLARASERVLEELQEFPELLDPVTDVALGRGELSATISYRGDGGEDDFARGLDVICKALDRAGVPYLGSFRTEWAPVDVPAPQLV